jgi:hypothetical protein
MSMNFLPAALALSFSSSLIHLLISIRWPTRIVSSSHGRLISGELNQSELLEIKRYVGGINALEHLGIIHLGILQGQAGWGRLGQERQEEKG